MIIEICAVSLVVIQALRLVVDCILIAGTVDDDVEPLTEEMRCKIYS